MLQKTHDALRALLPRATEEEIETAGECLRRYIELAVAIADSLPEKASEAGLTPSNTGGSVNAGLVDPETFTNTG